MEEMNNGKPWKLCRVCFRVDDVGEPSVGDSDESGAVEQESDIVVLFPRFGVEANLQGDGLCVLEQGVQKSG